MSLEQADTQKNQHGTHQEIYQVVALIPYGKVATYGQIARLAGLPRHARLVGYALNRLGAEHDLPWHPVINAQGRISLPAID
ncbi:MAG: methyltransferase, partial [Sphingobacteriales bacterium]